MTVAESEASMLVQKHCKPCEGSTPAIPGDRADQLIHNLPGWERRGGEIQRMFKFQSFHETMAFANAVAWIAHMEDHHPDMEVSYNKCTVRYSTHAINGLSENDFICAAKVQALM